MLTTKLIDNNRRVHAAKVLAQASRKHQVHEESEESLKSDTDATSADEKDGSLQLLRKQYVVIREDVLKLREDLAQGYDLVLDYFKENANLRNLIRIK